MNVKPLIVKYRIRPQKKLGQNFLIDNNIREKMCHSLLPNTNDTVLEIGPGCGSLTAILVNHVGRLVAVEKDKKCVAILKEEIGEKSPHFEVVSDSILKYDISQIAPATRLKVIGNLPYNITTKVLFHLIKHSSSIDFAILTMQKEVAERILAMPGSRAYGRLSVSVRYSAKVEKLFDISPGCFYPVPDVTSTVLKFTFLKRKKQVDEALLYDVIRALFQQRRKSIHNSLMLVESYDITKSVAKDILATCDIDPKKRAEELMIKDFLAITKEIEKSI